MVLFVFIGHSPIKSFLSKEIAKSTSISYTSTYDYSIKTELVKGILKRLNSKENIILDVKHRTNEVFSHSFIKKLENHFVIYFILSGKDNKTLDLVKKWPNYFVFNFEQQSIELICHMIGEIMQLNAIFSKFKPFKEVTDKSFVDKLFIFEPLEGLEKIPIQGLYYLMLSVINCKSIGNNNVSLKELIGTLMHFNSIPTKTMVKGTPILRVRFNDLNSSGPILFEEVNQLWHPPKLLTHQGRFNHEKQPVLYAADNIFTCFYETINIERHGKQGYVTALSCIVTEDITEGYISALDTHLSQGKNIFYDSFVKFYNGNISEKEKIIKNFLGNYINSQKFFTPKFSYEITNLIGDIVMQNKDIHAIMYPSTRINMQYNNIIINEVNAKKYIKPHGVIVYFYTCLPNYEVSLKPVYFGEIISNKIEYKYVDRPSIQSVIRHDS